MLNRRRRVVRLGGVGIKRKRYLCEMGGFTSSSGAFFGPQNRALKLREMTFLGDLAHSGLCWTDADVGLKEKCGSVEMGYNRKKKIL